MCGIFGILIKPDNEASVPLMRKAADLLFNLSETRGKEAAGLAMRANGRLTVYKQPLAASVMLKQAEYDKLYKNLSGAKKDGVIGLIGHSRLVTNGQQTLPSNNQPVVKDGLVGIHNGIITNDGDLWDKFPSLRRLYEVDTEVFLSLVRMFKDEGADYTESAQKAFSQIEGMASVAIFPEDADIMLLATNNGSLYSCVDSAAGAMAFASESYILHEFLEDENVKKLFPNAKTEHIKAREGYTIGLDNLSIERFSLTEERKPASVNGGTETRVEIIDLSAQDDPARAVLRRCSKCVLPETIPFIEFNEEGVCNFCETSVYKPPIGEDDLEKAIAPYRSKAGEYDCVVAFSGGRDSCYGLHYVKEVMGMNPVAFTYDWGMVTDLARRNQARLCGKLGVEHIIISADIKKKREYIRKNVLAWLKRPEMGIIPLFMAGDKMFYYYAYQVMKQTGAKVIIFAENTNYERAQFKQGFCGVNESAPRPFNISLGDKIKLTSYYLKQYVKNPSYINASFLDTAYAYYCSYMLKHDFIFLFDYIKWKEEEIVSTLRNVYNWELATDTTATWRIGDGTTAFYNYIYYTVGGFTENDTFRSHQIRDGAMMRDKALELVREENKPRWESMRWYANTIGFDLDEAIRVINSVPKLYSTEPEYRRG